MTTFSLLVAALKNVPVRKFIAALEKDGFIFFEGTRSSHRVYSHSDGREVVISFHKGNQTLPRGTLRAFLRSTHWNEDDAITLDLMARPRGRR